MSLKPITHNLKPSSGFTPHQFLNSNSPSQIINDKHNKKERTGSVSLKTGGGFTLVEVLVALVILGLAVSATFFVLVTNLNNAGSVRNSFVASGLAQEGIEVARNIRDRDWFLGNSFGTSIPDGTYRLQWNSLALMPLGSNPPLLKDAATGIFSYDTGTNTIFSRTVAIATPAAGVEKKVTVTISWNERGRIATLSAEEHLYNWK